MVVELFATLQHVASQCVFHFMLCYACACARVGVGVGVRVFEGEQNGYVEVEDGEVPKYCTLPALL